MNDRFTVRGRFGAWVFGFALLSGCGGGTVDTGPAEQPNVGPGMPPGKAEKVSGGASASSPGKAQPASSK